MDLTRISRELVEWDVTATLPDTSPASITAIDVALLPPRTAPDASTVWSAPVSFVTPVLTVRLAGPDASPTAALVAAGTSDLWARITLPGEVRPVLLFRVTVLEGEATAVVPVSTLADAYVAGLVTGVTGTRDALKAALVPFWAPNEAVATNAVRMDATGRTIKRIASGTTRATYDATEQALWTVTSSGGGGGSGITSGSTAGQIPVWDGDSWEPATPTDVTAADIPFTPSGTIAATNVQAAIVEDSTETATTIAALNAALAALTDRVTALEGGTVTYHILTEALDSLTTEAGDFLVTQ